MRAWPLLLGCVGLPLLAAAASPPKISSELARERFAPVVVTRQVPPPLWDAVSRFVRNASLVDASDPSGDAREPSNDLGEIPYRRGCIAPHFKERIFSFGGLGSKLDFVIYEHRNHDHLLVFRRLSGGYRSLAFSCVGKLPRKAAAVSAAVAAGRCKEKTGPVETD